MSKTGLAEVVELYPVRAGSSSGFDGTVEKMELSNLRLVLKYNYFIWCKERSYDTKEAMTLAEEVMGLLFEEDKT